MVQDRTNIDEANQQTFEEQAIPEDENKGSDSEQETWQEEEQLIPEPIPTINIKAIGDVMLARGVAFYAQGDYTVPFKETADLLRNSDITFANLECSLSDRGEKLTHKGVWLRAEPKAVEGIRYAGIDVVNIGNNHILDYNEPALLDTIEILEKNYIKHIGAGVNLSDARKPAIVEVKNRTVGFLGYSDLYQYGFGIPGTNKLRFFEAKEDVSGIAPLKYEMIKEDIHALRGKVDILAVSLHWGVEDSHYITQEQREMAHNIIDDGADMILGHHPHVLQGIEIYKGKPIIYSMGNFVFDQNKKPNNESMLVDMEFEGDKLSRLEVIPLQIIGQKQTIRAKDEDAAHILGYLQKLCDELDTKARITEEGTLVFEL
ncbi:MAG: CapA family protein [Clostridiaceae bacterium]|nr:CapA family protein [Clostridiaceae bacterium]